MEEMNSLFEFDIFNESHFAWNYVVFVKVYQYLIMYFIFYCEFIHSLTMEQFISKDGRDFH